MSHSQHLRPVKTEQVKFEGGANTKESGHDVEMLEL